MGNGITKSFENGSEQDFDRSSIKTNNKRNIKEVCIGEEEDKKIIMLKEQKLRGSIINLSNLNILTLDSEFASHLPKNLKMLTISHNHLSLIPETILVSFEFQLFGSLTLLDLSHNQLTQLPENISNLYNLTEIKLQHNKLSLLPDSITCLKKLQILDVSYNSLTHLPTKLESMLSLVSIDARQNLLTSIPAQISKLKNLRKLNLDECPLMRGPPTPQKSSSPPTLRELAARVIVRHGIPVPQTLPNELKNYLAKSNKCTFCEGPYFEEHVLRYRFITKGAYVVALEHKLCTAHWDTEKKRILSVFRPQPKTAPRKLENSNSSSSLLLCSFSSSSSSAPPLSSDYTSSSSSSSSSSPIRRTNSVQSSLNRRRASITHTAKGSLSSPLPSLQELKSMSRNNSSILRESH